MPSLKVVILSRDRPSFLKDSISSAVISLKQIPKHVNSYIEISDNSESEECVELIRQTFPYIQVKLRRPCITSYQHFINVISEAETDYLVIFHDDDVMKIDFLPDLYNLLYKNNEISAVACNANFLRHGRETEETFIKKVNLSNAIDPERLINSYFLFGEQGIAPFPSYMYRVSHLKDIVGKFKPLGKYADVAFLLTLSQKAPFLWTNRILMSYRVHGQNDSSIYSITDQFKLLRFLRKQFRQTSPALNDFRLSIFIFWLKSRNLNLLRFFLWTKLQKAVFKFALAEVFKRFLFRPETIKVFVKKYKGAK
jgi:hypothetical protein